MTWNEWIGSQTDQLTYTQQSETSEKVKNKNPAKRRKTLMELPWSKHVGQEPVKSEESKVLVQTLLVHTTVLRFKFIQLSQLTKWPL